MQSKNPLSLILTTAAATALVFVPIGYASSHMRSQCPKTPVTTETIIQEPKPSDWDKLPDCQQEDQTSPDCKWDAGTRGNGEGYSFYVRNGEYHYVIAG